MEMPEPISLCMHGVDEGGRLCAHMFDYVPFAPILQSLSLKHCPLQSRMHPSLPLINIFLRISASSELSSYVETTSVLFTFGTPSVRSLFRTSTSRPEQSGTLKFTCAYCAATDVTAASHPLKWTPSTAYE